MAITTLTPVIKVDVDKCINCYACIAICPAKYCMNGSGEKLEINHNLCIGCGNCIAACTHKARDYSDDTARFYEQLKAGEKMIAIAAPATASVFKDQYLNLNGYLKSLGIKAVFDVSLGAELTVISYLDYITKQNPRFLIAQPCPAIVNFLELYHPELLPYLAPADSPMLHIIKLIREFYPEYRDHKIAVISPCIAKRREFDETGMGDYNITMMILKKHLEAQKINLSSYPKVEYVGLRSERATRFSMPGGLMETADRFSPGIRRRARKIEGVHAIYPYLKEIADLLNTNTKISPIIDCLNCEKGCNGGPGTGNSDKPLALLESPIYERSAKLEEYHKGQKGEWKYPKKYLKELNKLWKTGLYKRTYRDLSGNNTIKTPNQQELVAIFESMHKYSDKDIYNCTACGYGSCNSMAVAIHNKLNKRENCAHYTLIALQKEEEHIREVNNSLHTHINHAVQLIDGINNVVDSLSTQVSSQATALDESSRATNKMIHSIAETSEFSTQKKESVKDLIDNVAKGQDSMHETIRSVKEISESVEDIASAIKIITGIAANTNLLAMNAAIEAAHAGEAGKGFAVVADEIRRLSETTQQNSRSISSTLSNIVQGISNTSMRSTETNSLITRVAEEVSDFTAVMTELINTFSELSMGSSEITTALDCLRDISGAIKTGYAEMFSMTDKLRTDMDDLSKVSRSSALQ